MKLCELLTKIIHRRPKVTVILTIPKELIDGNYHNVIMTTDAVVFAGCYGILKNDYIFKGTLKVELK